MNQNQRVLNHLIDHGYATQLVMSTYGVKRLASRMTDLKKAGVAFTRQNRIDDTGVRYAYYELSSERREFEGGLRANGYNYKGDYVGAVDAARAA